ncbi:MAG: hypothetical protein JWM09_1287 [Francisellaceae bacterium]|nr:hypothetical protein [Francisellaceae bacterium]
MMKTITPEILINASLVTDKAYGETFEFVLNETLTVLECIKLGPLNSKPFKIQKPEQTLSEYLFELNHVRVNPQVDNTLVISSLTNAFTKIGVKIENPPFHNSIAICYRPLGEIVDNVRFYLKEDSRVIFLSPAVRPRLVSSK